MCVVSMVHDEYEPRIPTIRPYVPWVPTGEPFVVPMAPQADIPSASLRELNALIHEFKRLLENAKEIDEKTGQPDCVDPEKAKLQERVAQLEALLNKAPEFVIVTGGQLEPGRYRVLDGHLYKLVDGASKVV